MLKILWILEINAFSLRKMLFSLVLRNAEIFMFENANCTALLRKRENSLLVKCQIDNTPSITKDHQQ